MAVAGALSHPPVLVHATEVSSTRTRRRFTTAQKLQMVLEAEACTERGTLGALLCREGLYASQLAMWRRAYERGELRGNGKARGRAPQVIDPSVARIAQLERELAKVTARADTSRRCARAYASPGRVTIAPGVASPIRPCARRGRHRRVH